MGLEMLCPNGHDDPIKFGTFKHVNGVSQRYRCRMCNVVFSEGKLGMNRLPIAKREALELALREGLSHRKAALVAGVAMETARKNAYRIGILPKPRKKGQRERGDYVRLWQERQPVIGEKRLERNDIIRASVALWLAKNVKPLSSEQIFRAMLPQFPWLKSYSIKNMLNFNADHCFKKVGDKFTFEPSMVYSPCLHFKPGKTRKKYYLLMDAARAAWFQARNIPDHHVEEFIERLKEQNAEHIKARQREAIDATRPLLQLMATAAALQNHNERI